VPTLMTAYAISGLCAGGAALFYVMLTASGDPTSGDGLILPSVAAVVHRRGEPVRRAGQLRRDGGRRAHPDPA